MLGGRGVLHRCGVLGGRRMLSRRWMLSRGRMGGRASRLDYPGSFENSRFRSGRDGRMSAVRLRSQIGIAARRRRMLHLRG
jgi:hypothetical protein